MNTTRRLDLLFGAVMIAVAALFLPRIFLQDTFFFGELLSDKVVVVIGSVVKLLCLATAALFAGRAVPHFEPGNRARPGWRLMQLGLAAYFLGQLFLSSLYLLLPQPPFPSIADALFIAAMLLLLASLATFLHAYRRGGALRGGGAGAWAAGALLALGAFNVWLLRPIIAARAPFLETATNVAYPVLDTHLLVLATALLVTTLRFRGGQLWKVWLTLLAGFLFLCGGDVAYAHFSTMGMSALDPVMDVMYVWSYALLALGTIYQEELLTGR